MEIGWSFPSNNWGTIEGLNNAGVETFKGTPIESLTREIIQNSTDARRGNNSVEVVFHQYEIESDLFPDREEFIKILESCLDYWKDNQKTSSFFDNAINIMNKDYIKMLKISDYNTTGLTGANEPRLGNWGKLVKEVGTSDKGSGSGGSFGIGKHAPFACSNLRTVFYASRDENNVFAFQGTSKLVTHLRGDTSTQGTGFFGVIEKNMPILDLNKLPKFYHRKDIGTDIFIPGFEYENWKEVVIRSAIENFFMAIYEESLIITVDDVIISKDTLSDLIELYVINEKGLRSDQYFRAILNPDLHKKHDFKGLGEVELFLVTGLDLNKSVAMIRNTGMKIDDYNFRTPIKFSGVLAIRGERINEFLRQLEPPSHKGWEPERYHDPAFARRFIKELRDWIRQNINSLITNEDGEELDVPELNQFLPDDSEEIPVDSDVSGGEGEKSSPTQAKIISVPRNHINFSKDEVAASSNQQENFEENVPGNEMRRDFRGFSNKQKERGRNFKKGYLSKNIGNKRVKTKNKPTIKRLRVFCSDASLGEYKISVTTDLQGKGLLHFYTAGETANDPAPIKKAFINDKKTVLSIKNLGVVGPINFNKDKTINMTIYLDDNQRYAMEVYISEYK